MSDFRIIFERHYFSNHHVEAIEVERRFEEIFQGFHCITYSSLPSLLVAVVDEICGASKSSNGFSIVASNDSEIDGLNRFLRATMRRSEIVADDSVLAQCSAQAGVRPGIASIPLRAVVMSDSQVVGRCYDMAGLDSMLLSAGLFVTPEAEFAEKLRWSRSSYGRRAPTRINIAANGRFSEFQGRMVNNALNNRGIGS